MSSLTGTAAVLAGSATLFALAGASGDFPPHSRTAEPSVLLGIDSHALCLTRGKADRRVFYRVAATRKNELTPYGQLPQTEAEATGGDPPLWQDLGTLSWKITTDAPLAQQHFNQGLRLASASTMRTPRARSAPRRKPTPIV